MFRNPLFAKNQADSDPGIRGCRVTNLLNGDEGCGHWARKLIDQWWNLPKDPASMR
jgi:hypothetical protein